MYLCLMSLFFTKCDNNVICSHKNKVWLHRSSWKWITTICLNVLGTHCLTHTAKSSSYLGILLSEILVLSLSWCAWKNIHFPVVTWNLNFFYLLYTHLMDSKTLKKKKKIHISGPNLIQRGFMVLIPAFSHVLCMGKSEGYVLSKLAGSRNSPSLWHPGRWSVGQWQMDVYWVDTAGIVYSLARRSC